MSEELKQENEREESKSKGKQKNIPLDISSARLCIKDKFLRKQWRKFTDRVKMGGGNAPVEEPEWFTFLNPIFSDTMGEMEKADNDGPNTPNTSSNQDRAEESCDSADGISSETSSSSRGTKRKQKEP